MHSSPSPEGAAHPIMHPVRVCEQRRRLGRMGRRRGRDRRTSETEVREAVRKA